MVAIIGHSDRLLTSIGRSCRFALRVVLCVLAISSAQSCVVTQESTRSHRLLGNGLPTLSGGQSQIELLRRLQLLSGAAQANGKTPADSPLADPEAMKRLQQAMQSLQKLNAGQSDNPQPFPQGSQPTPDQPSAGGRNSDPSQAPSADRGTGPDGSSPDSGSPGTSPPEARSFEAGAPTTQPRQKDRPGTRPLNPRGNANTPPDATPQGTVPGLRPGQRSDGSNPSTGQRPGNPATGNANGGRPTLPPGLPSGNSSRPGPGDRTPGSRTTGSDPRMAPGSRTPEPAEPPKSTMQSVLNWFEKRDQSASGGGLPSELPDRTPGSRSGMPRNGQTRQPGTNTGRPTQTPDRNRGDVANGGAATPSEPATPGNSWFPGGSIAPPRSQQGNASTNQGRTNQGTGQSGNESRPSPGSQLPQTDNATPDTSPADSSTGENNATKSPAQLLQDRLNAQREERLDEVRDSKKTLRQKFMDIAKLARSESDQVDPSNETTDASTDAGVGDNLQSAFVDALAEATKGLAEQVDDIVTENRSSRRDRDGRSRRRERDGPWGQLAGIGNRANEWFVDSVEPEAPSTSTMSDGFGGATPTGFNISTKLLIALILVGGFAFWLLQKKRVEAKLDGSQSTRSSAPANLQNRQDIVQAFHDLADRCPAVMADWWTHDRAAQALVTSRPDVDDEVRQLAQLYEQARYQPEESALTDEQLAAAKAAWLRCRKS